MRSVLSKQVRRDFERGLMRLVPDARRLPPAKLPASCIGWVLGQEGDAIAYVILIISPKEDSFSIEVSWSSKGGVSIPEIGLDTEAASANVQGQCRRLGPESSFGRDHWYNLWQDADTESGIPEDLFDECDSIEDRIARVPEKVQRALRALEIDGIPYLRSSVGLPVVRS